MGDETEDIKYSSVAGLAITVIGIVIYRKAAKPGGGDTKVTIGVGTNNTAKVQAVHAVAAKLFGSEGGYELFAYGGVESGVSDQPMSAAECLKGATNRAEVGGLFHAYTPPPLLTTPSYSLLRLHAPSRVRITIMVWVSRVALRRLPKGRG
jgi:hypothetical protein